MNLEKIFIAHIPDKRHTVLIIKNKLRTHNSIIR